MTCMVFSSPVSRRKALPGYRLAERHCTNRETYSRIPRRGVAERVSGFDVHGT